MSVGDVLVVDDNEVARRIALEQLAAAQANAYGAAAAMLAKFGCCTSLANDGEDAVRQVKQRRFDLILMDCQMPVMDGFEAMRMIRALEERQRLPNTPIVALTANAMKDDDVKCLEAGMNGYLSKPLKPDALEDALLTWLPIAKAAGAA